MLFLPAYAAVERTVSKSFEVPLGGKFFLDTFHGEVSLVKSQTRELHVTVDLSIDTDDVEQAERVFQQLAVEISQGKDLTITARCVFTRPFRWSWSKWPPADVVWTIEVPEQCELDLLCREGGITMGDHKGDVRVRTLRGTVFAGEITGNVSAEVQGDFTATAVGGKLNAKVNGGNVVLGRVVGAAKIQGGDGAVDIKTVKSSCSVDWDGEEVRVGFAYPLGADAEIENHRGDVVVTLDPRVDADFDLKSGAFGKVRMRELPGLTPPAGDSARKYFGKLNNGGPRVLSRARSGTIRVTGVPSLP